MSVKFEDAGDVFRQDLVMDVLRREFDCEVSRLPGEFALTDVFGHRGEQLLFIAEIKCRPNVSWGDYPSICFEREKYHSLMRFKGYAPLWFIPALGLETVHVLDVTELDMTKIPLVLDGGRTTNTRPNAVHDVTPCYYPENELFVTLNERQRPYELALV